MSSQIWLYWFPVALLVGLAGLVLGRSRGRLIGLMGALYWLALSVSRIENVATGGVLEMSALALGAAAIVWIGFWAPSSAASRQRRTTQRSTNTTDKDTRPNPYANLLEVLTRFEDWLPATGDKAVTWPEFGEFVYSAVSLAVGARHVRAYQLPPGIERLQPLTQSEAYEKDSPSARVGIVGHVVTTGRSYYAGDPTQGELVEKLAADSELPCVWCFAVKHHKRTVGLIHVGQLDDEHQADRAYLSTVERVIRLCWITFAEAHGGRLASNTDPVSGIPTRDAFMEAANRSLRASYEHGEPVALVNITIEGLRSLTDNEQWEQANEVIYEVSSVLKERVRQDDEIGVFDASSFLLLMRRVDSQLATLIAKQLVARLNELCGAQERWGVPLTARCGLVGSGLGQPTLRNLVGRATASYRRAREEDVALVSDLPEPVETAST